MKFLRNLAVASAALFGATGLTAKGKEEIKDLRTHSLQGFHPMYWDIGGDAVIDTQKKIRLTPDYPDRQGYAWSTQFLPDDTWKVEFEFRIHGKGSYLYGDGMAFFVAQERTTPGPVFGNRDYFKGFGLFFDTYANAKHTYNFPHIMGMQGDGKTPYMANSDGDPNSVGGCSPMYRGTTEPVKASVVYLKGKYLQVRYQLHGEKWEDCFTVNNATLPEKLYLGFTAHTGEISDNHDLISVKTQTMDASTAANLQHQDNAPLLSKQNAWAALGWWFKLVLVGAVCGVAFMGYRAYTAKQNERF
ncbi:hypothetical protein IWQ60_001659 [Tieghemiomyces parasiticus]|uniref:L-type lectin-like domain-containing protein n=1 Tax=Tieghemiomyces parasiticus TaxID=78921 RepID=A0A9W8AE62_9FUNG|nr:hypothetical protein IWQ60_001659 [Tieghemiomyces parasiticus]